MTNTKQLDVIASVPAELPLVPMILMDVSRGVSLAWTPRTSQHPQLEYMQLKGKDVVMTDTYMHCISLPSRLSRTSVRLS